MECQLCALIYVVSMYILLLCARLSKGFVLGSSDYEYIENYFTDRVDQTHQRFGWLSVKIVECILVL